MAKKKQTSNSNKKTVTLTTGFFTFWGIVCAAAAVLVSLILGRFGLGVVANVFEAIAAVFICIAIVPPAWRHVAHKNIAWKIIFIVAVIIYIVCIVLARVL